RPPRRRCTPPSGLPRRKGAGFGSWLQSASTVRGVQGRRMRWYCSCEIVLFRNPPKGADSPLWNCPLEDRLESGRAYLQAPFFAQPFLAGALAGFLAAGFLVVLAMTQLLKKGTSPA